METGCERYGKTCAYDSEHRLIDEKDGRHRKTYSYYDGTNLLAAYTWDDGRIAMRQCYAYDENNALILEITDDGYELDRDNLTGVTMRRIKAYAARKSYPIGAPDHCYERVLDMSAGQERLVSLYVNTFSDQGKIIQQDHYDANHQLAYTLHWKYDARGRLIYERNAIGEEIIRGYDENDNQIVEHGPRGDRQKRFFYDFCNRLIRVDEAHPERTLSTSFRYDHLSRKISETDAYGNETRFVYDDFGRVIETTTPQVLDENGLPYNPCERYAYDAFGNVTAKTDPQGHTTQTFYTVRGQPYLIVYPDSSQERFE